LTLTTAPFDLLRCRFCGTYWGAIGVVIPQACVECYKEDWIMYPQDRDPDEDRSNWQRANTPDAETLVQLRDLVIEFLELHGRPPTAIEMQQGLQHPGR
jgi:hypothetical protein